MSIRLLAAASLLLASAFAALAATPAEVVARMYGNVGWEASPERRHLFTDPAATKFAQNEAAFDRGDIGCIDFGVAIDGQDFDEEELARTLELTETVSGSEATVEARFLLFGEPRLIEWTLREIDGAWLIADVAGPENGWRLSEFDCE